METIGLSHALIIVAVIYLIWRSLFGCPFGCEAIFNYRSPFERFQSQMAQFRGKEYAQIMAGLEPNMYQGYDIREPVPTA